MADESLAPPHKTCRWCNETKPLDAFRGRRHQCRACMAAYARERYRQNPAKKRANAKKWTDNNPEKNLAKTKRWQRNNPDKARENNRTNSAKWRRNHPIVKSDTARAGARVPPVRRRCTVCQEHKPIEDFYHKHYQCRPCLSATRKAQYRQNPEKVRASVRMWKRQNPEKVLTSVLTWKRNNPEKARAHARTQYHNNPAKQAAKDRKRRAHKHHAAINDFTLAQWQEMQAAYDHRCAYCGKRCKGKLTQDHIIPLSKGGNHTKSNIVPACQSCNSKKGTGAPLVPVQPLLL
jgi:hypothetical protein